MVGSFIAIFLLMFIGGTGLTIKAQWTEDYWASNSWIPGVSGVLGGAFLFFGAIETISSLFKALMAFRCDWLLYAVLLCMSGLVLGAGMGCWACKKLN